MAAYLPYVIPILTFALGAALTLFLKGYDKRTAIISTYARELSDCTNEWYQQIHDLVLHSDDSEFQKHVLEYEHRRLVLPRLLRAIAALRHYPEASTIVIQADRILSILTRQKTSQYITYAACETGFASAGRQRDDLGCRRFLHSADLPAGFEASVMLKDATFGSKDAAMVTLLDSLDNCIQQINIEAGKVIAQGYRSYTVEVIGKYYRRTVEVIGKSFFKLTHNIVIRLAMIRRWFAA
jgi:hypothetical protein